MAGNPKSGSSEIGDQPVQLERTPSIRAQEGATRDSRPIVPSSAEGAHRGTSLGANGGAAHAAGATPSKQPRAAAPLQPPRSTPLPGELRVWSAERKEREMHGLAPRLKSDAENAVLNALSYARDAAQDLRRLDRFFKYKLAIVAGWVILSVITLSLVLPRSDNTANSLGARLVVTTVLDHPVYMVKNEGADTWKDVVVVVNRRYRAAASEVAPGHELTLGPRQLLGENGTAAPPNLELTDFEVRTSHGKTTLVEQGRPR